MTLRPVIGFVALIFLLFLSGVSVSGAASAPFTDEVTGISFGPLTDNPEIEELNEIEDLIKAAGFDVTDEVTVLRVDKNEGYIVFSDDPIPAGEATVTGQTLSYPGEDLDVIIADDFEVDKVGERATFDEIREDPESYKYEVVELESSISVGSFVLKPSSGIASKMGLFSIDEPGEIEMSPIEFPPGSHGRWATINASDNDIGDQSEIQSKFSDDSGSGLSYEKQFWGYGDADVTVALLPNYFGTGEGEMEFTGFEFLLVDIDYDSETIYSVSELENRGDELEGETVTLDTDLVGSRTSSQEFLTSVVSCGDQTVWIPKTPLCVPVMTDSVIHSGVLVDHSSTAVPYAAVSSEIQHTMVEPEHGQYEVTGEVVSANEFEFNIPSEYGLLVYDMQQTSGLSLSSSVESDARNYANQIESDIQAQLNHSSDGESNAVDSSSDDTVQIDDPPEDASDDNSDKSDNGNSSNERNDEPYIKGTYLQDSEVVVGEEFTASVIIQNPSDEKTEKGLTLFADGEEVGYRTADVALERSQLLIRGSLDESGSYEIKVNEETAGRLHIEEASDERSDGAIGEVGSYISGASSAGGYLLGVLGIVSFLSVVILESMRSYKQHFTENELSTSDKPGIVLFAVSVVSLLSAGLLVGGFFAAIGFVLVACSAVGLFLYGWVWALKLVYEEI